MRIGIIGYYGFNNLGDELNLYCMMENLKEQFHSVEFLIFSDCRKIEGYVDYPIVGLNYSFPSGTSIKDALNSCDLLIIGGGGLIYLGDFWFPFMEKDITIPYIIHRVGIDDRKVNPNAVRKHKKMFLRAQEVTVRDHYSLQLCKKYLTDKVEVVPEAIWNHPYKEINQKQIEEKNIGINLRSFSPEVYPAFQTFFDHLRKQGYKLNFIPCQVMEQNLNLNDNKYHKLVEREGDFILPDDSSYQERCRLISEMDLCIGMRLHFVLLSLSQRVPVIALNYNNKVKGLMDEAGLSRYTIDLYRSNLPELLMNATKGMEQEKENIRFYLDKRIAVFEQGAKKEVKIYNAP